MDETVNGGDGGAADLLNNANSAMQWGSVIGSIVTNTPITAAQTRSGGFQTIGPAGTTVAPSPINWTAIGLAVVAAVVIAFVVRGAK
jgi:hypothetical protein